MIEPPPKASSCGRDCATHSCTAFKLAITIAFLIYAWPTLISMTSGVFQTSSTDLDEEARVFAARLSLKPGMTLCEMGSANGALLSKLAPYVMPGGRLVATSILKAELSATADAINKIGLDADAVLTTYLATSRAWAPGLSDGSCDALYSRMVIHMIPKPTVAVYIPQWRKALNPGSLMFHTDHNPMDGGTTGPRRPITNLFGFVPMMPVVPQETEVAEILNGGPFQLVDGPFAHEFFHMGYGAVYSPV